MREKLQLPPVAKDQKGCEIARLRGAAAAMLAQGVSRAGPCSQKGAQHRQRSAEFVVRVRWGFITMAEAGLAHAAIAVRWPRFEVGPSGCRFDLHRVQCRMEFGVFRLKAEAVTLLSATLSQEMNGKTLHPPQVDFHAAQQDKGVRVSPAALRDVV